MVPASRVREAVDEAVAPLHRVIEELQTRLADLEKGLLAQPPAASGATQPSAPPGAHFHESAPATFARPAQVLDVAAIERDVHIPIDRALDGRRRQRRVVTTVALLIALTLGSFVVALVYSYASRGDREGSTGSFIGDRVLA